MCVSDEPGYYEDGKFGIRIENVIVVQDHKEFNEKLRFENLTKVPYSIALIDKSLLTATEFAHINKYHLQVLEELTPLLKDDEISFAYLKRSC
jgi:Xaa-Pro aminopeptidase